MRYRGQFIKAGDILGQLLKTNIVIGSSQIYFRGEMLLKYKHQLYGVQYQNMPGTANGQISITKLPLWKVAQMRDKKTPWYGTDLAGKILSIILKHKWRLIDPLEQWPIELKYIYLEEEESTT